MSEYELLDTTCARCGREIRWPADNVPQMCWHCGQEPPEETSVMPETLPATPPDPVHFHRFVLPRAADGAGLWIGRCLCGATKDHRPYGKEEAADFGRQPIDAWGRKANRPKFAVLGTHVAS